MAGAVLSAAGGEIVSSNWRLELGGLLKLEYQAKLGIYFIIPFYGMQQ